MTTKLVMTKIVVADLDAASAFYQAVCGLVAVNRIEDATFAEIIMRTPDSSSAALVLINYKNTMPPVPGECILVFDTSNVQDFIDRAVAAGGLIMQPAVELASMELIYAFVRDPEGHIIEAIQRT